MFLRTINVNVCLKEKERMLISFFFLHGITFCLTFLSFLRVSFENGETVYQSRVHTSRYKSMSTRRLGSSWRNAISPYGSNLLNHLLPLLLLQLSQTKSNLHKQSYRLFLLIHSVQQMTSAYSGAEVSRPGALGKKIISVQDSDFITRRCFLDSSWATYYKRIYPRRLRNTGC